HHESGPLQFKLVGAVDVIRQASGRAPLVELIIGVRSWMDMTSMITTEEVLKQDALGRVRVPLERRHAILAEFVKSGSSAAQFARLVGIKYQTFCCWVQKQRRERRLVSGPTVAEPVGEKVQVTQGGRVRLFEALVEGDKSGGRQRSGWVGGLA